MKLTGRIEGASVGLDGECLLTLTVNERCSMELIYDKLHDCEKLDIDIKKHRKKRSLSANAYLWVLCGKIADKVGCAAVDVYRQHILDTNVYKTIEVNKAATDTLITAWQRNGEGWLATKVGTSRHGEFDILNLYYGSSVYNTAQMSRLIDGIIDDCRELNIDTKTPKEIADMMNLWETERKTKQNQEDKND